MNQKKTVKNLKIFNNTLLELKEAINENFTDKEFIKTVEQSLDYAQRTLINKINQLELKPW